MPDYVDATGDDRTVNNTMNQKYRVLSETEKHQVGSVKECGDLFLQVLETLPKTREMALAKTKIEEAVMWAVKGVTA